MYGNLFFFPFKPITTIIVIKSKESFNERRFAYVHF